jgi:hypothetical protein
VGIELNLYNPWEWVVDWVLTTLNWLSDALGDTWILPLLDIRGVETLRLEWETNVTLVQRVLKAAKLMRIKMFTLRR